MKNERKKDRKNAGKKKQGYEGTSKKEGQNRIKV